MKIFLKAIIVGIGGIAPGLSGSVLLVIFGLYEKTIHTIGNLFKDLKNNIRFLFPLVCGFGVGVLIFSKVVDFLLTEFSMFTQFSFLGLLIGTVPLFYKEVKKEGFDNKYYIPMAISFVIGLALFVFNRNLFPQVVSPSFLQSIVLGVAVAGSTIIPGVDSASILSAFGLYNIYVSSIANLDFSILIPAGIGVVVGVLVISYLVSKVLVKHYTLMFSIIFGLFLTIIPTVIDKNYGLGVNVDTFISIVLLVVGFMISFLLGNIRKPEQDEVN